MRNAGSKACLVSIEPCVSHASYYIGIAPLAGGGACDTGSTCTAPGIPTTTVALPATTAAVPAVTTVPTAISVSVMAAEAEADTDIR
jgi:hypothetical protein